ncbi:hypothetical protein [Crystallibacter degradans]|uniref:hypothetical protein n=1 Tax=Crystallibacter degradans TaxID=2726743 RepID=UPI0014764B1C|nr:hypothetical protein [Arthrobacter sp. SF27]NMR31959.1 hypothetical protein [Arthrobacter sp. SF27]
MEAFVLTGIAIPVTGLIVWAIFVGRRPRPSAAEELAAVFADHRTNRPRQTSSSSDSIALLAGGVAASGFISGTDDCPPSTSIFSDSGSFSGGDAGCSF